MKLSIAILQRNVRKRIRALGSKRAVAREIGVTHTALDSLLAGRRPQVRNRLKYDAWSEEYFGLRTKLYKPRKIDLERLDAAIKRIVTTIQSRPLDEQPQLYVYTINKLGTPIVRKWKEGK